MGKVIIKNQSQINSITESGKYLTELLNLIYDIVKPGVALIELEEAAEKYINNKGLKGAFKGYMGFPANLCLSVDDCVVHGIPDNYVLKDGDLLKVDCGITYNKGITDAAFSKVVGGADKDSYGNDLINTTKKSLDTSLEFLIPNSFLFNFSKNVQSVVEGNGFVVIKNLTGHGVGVKVHEAPHIFNWAHPESKSIKIVENMVLALEPITSFHSDNVVTKKGNDWNLYTENGDKGAQREYTVLITSNGPKVLAGLTGNY